MRPVAWLAGGLFIAVFAAGIAADGLTREWSATRENAAGTCPPLHAMVGTEKHTDAAGNEHERIVCLDDEQDMHEDPMIVTGDDDFHTRYGRYVVPKPTNTYLFRYGQKEPTNGGDHVRAIFSPRGAASRPGSRDRPR